MRRVHGSSACTSPLRRARSDDARGARHVHQVTEEHVLSVFTACGTIVDSRMCGDPNSALRFAFVEFDSEEAVAKARMRWRKDARVAALP